MHSLSSGGDAGEGGRGLFLSKATGKGWHVRKYREGGEIFTGGRTGEEKGNNIVFIEKGGGIYLKERRLFLHLREEGPLRLCLGKKAGNHYSLTRGKKKKKLASASTIREVRELFVREARLRGRGGAYVIQKKGGLQYLQFHRGKSRRL